MTPLSLTVELVPSTAWGRNVRAVLSKTDWDTLRRQTFQRDGYHCIYCNSNHKLHCHERWDYFEESALQRLVRLETICSLCHHIKHLGHTERLCQQGKLEWSAVTGHFCKVNHCSHDDFLTHRKEAFKAWERLSKIEWKLDLRLLETLGVYLRNVKA